eukprot:573258-Pelagomonas_calceolata.AAC.1
MAWQLLRCSGGSPPLEPPQLPRCSGGSPPLEPPQFTSGVKMARQLLKCSVGKEGGIEGQVGRWTPGVGSGGLVDTWGWLRWAGGHLGLAHVGRWAPEVPPETFWHSNCGHLRPSARWPVVTWPPIGGNYHIPAPCAHAMAADEILTSEIALALRHSDGILKIFTIT